ncbi:unnamed protein product [Rotaria sp. Silwood1]|nr:unnamed protein product [Rotaria sp. Silwood1]CAF4980305.1 unnamed protein product [Rotaria sp. Silwood1]
MPSNEAKFKIPKKHVNFGVVVNPSNGLVSTGSQTSITVEVTSIEVIKFYIRFGLKVLGQDEQEIHMTGEVIEPNINILESEFNYGGVSILHQNNFILKIK